MQPTVLFAGKFLELVREKSWEYVQRKNNAVPVGIIAVTAENKLLLITQYRIPVDKVVVEIPAGLIGDSAQNESWQTAARRELEEETGYTAASFEKLTQGPTSAGLTSECVIIAKATGVTKAGPQHPDGDEQITVHEIPLPEVKTWLQAREADGLLIDPKVWIALYFLS